MSARTILIVEDEVKIAKVLKDYLEGAGYRVFHLERGDSASPWVKQNMPSLILLDILVPGIDGMEVCREVRKFSDVPIIMLTARVEEIDRLLGLELGADDYVCKPFSPREVVARVKAVLKRVHASPSHRMITVGEIALNQETRQVRVKNGELRLTLCEYNLLKTFLSHPDRVFSRNELTDAVQGYDFDGYDRTIDSHVKNIRRKIAQHLPGQEVISTVYGVGYKLNAPHGRDK